MREVVKRFGYERTFYVLANTVQTQGGDGRVSQANKQWARSSIADTILSITLKSILLQFL